MWRLNLHVQSRSTKDTQALAACLATDCGTTWVDDQSFELTIEEATCKDLRAMWNTRLRGLIATDSVLRVFGKGFLNPHRYQKTVSTWNNSTNSNPLWQKSKPQRQQVSSVRAQVQELEGTIKAVEEQPEGMALHRQMGGVLIQVSDRQELLKELKETLVSLKGHLERFTEREQQLIQTYDELKKSLQGAQE